MDLQIEDLRSKEDFRSYFLRKRRQLSEEEWSRRSASLLEEVFQQIDFSQYGVVHSFLPYPGSNEPDTFPILERLWAEQEVITTCPVMLENKQMEQRIYSAGARLTPNRHGIPEPLEEEVIAPSRTDLVLVPLAIADRKGQRIGYGGGYYDRFLAQCRSDCRKVGLLLTEPVDSFPFEADPWDIPLDDLIWVGT